MINYIKHICKHIYQRYYYRKSCIFDITCNISLNSSFEGANKIYPYTDFNGSLGYGSYISNNCSISANIGRFTSIAPHVRGNNGFHPYTYPFATTCPMFFSTRKQNGKTFANKQILNEIKSLPIIGNDCWIGENVFICGGIKIGDGAVVLAGAVVSKDIPDYAIVGGVPAKILKYRYDEETLNFLTKFKWWNKDLSWIKKNWKLLCDIEKLKMYSEEI